MLEGHFILLSKRKSTGDFIRWWCPCVFFSRHLKQCWNVFTSPFVCSVQRKFRKDSSEWLLSLQWAWPSWCSQWRSFQFKDLKYCRWTASGKFRLLFLSSKGIPGWSAQLPLSLFWSLSYPIQIPLLFWEWLSDEMLLCLHGMDFSGTSGVLGATFF